MDNFDIVEITSSNDLSHINKLIKKGWKLINTFKRVYEDGDQSLVYVIGRPHYVEE